MSASRKLPALCLLSAIFGYTTIISVSAEEYSSDATSQLFLGLRVTGEPSLRDECKGDYRALRFLEYDSTGAKGLIRVEREDSELRYTHRTFFETAAAKSSTRLIDAGDWDELVDEFRSGGFWSSGTEAKPWVTDALTWLFEACIDGHYHSLQAFPERDLRMNNAVGALNKLKLQESWK